VQRNSSAQIKLYLTVGELEENLIPFFHKFISFFGDGKYPGLTLTTEIFTGENHNPEAAALTYLHGIRRVYQVTSDEHNNKE
jgi:hypothetical protein